MPQRWNSYSYSGDSAIKGLEWIIKWLCGEVSIRGNVSL